jgi:hypothetical protein
MTPHGIQAKTPVVMLLILLEYQSTRHDLRNRRLRKPKDHDLPQFIAVIESCSTVANDTQIKYGI